MLWEELFLSNNFQFEGKLEISLIFTKLIIQDIRIDIAQKISKLYHT